MRANAGGSHEVTNSAVESGSDEMRARRANTQSGDTGEAPSVHLI